MCSLVEVSQNMTVLSLFFSKWALVLPLLGALCVYQAASLVFRVSIFKGLSLFVCSLFILSSTKLV